jgi:murein peptide amidase A
VEKLGKNIGKYLGEVIDIRRVLEDAGQAAVKHGWEAETFLERDSFRWLGLTRKVFKPEKRIYISTGIHGDEPAGPLAVLQLLQENRWPENADIWLCPCLNPTGFPLNTRENAQGVDLNRDYLSVKTEEIRAHIAWLERQPQFDVCLCLHEDWESNGFYVYELNPDNQPSLAEPIMKSVAQVCPIDMSAEIEGRPATGGIIRPTADPRSRPQWPEAFYLFTYKTRLSYTLEAPSDYQLTTRVAAEMAGVRAVLEGIERR